MNDAADDSGKIAFSVFPGIVTGLIAYCYHWSVWVVIAWFAGVTILMSMFLLGCSSEEGSWWDLDDVFDDLCDAFSDSGW